jgi:hypothetical protein
MCVWENHSLFFKIKKSAEEMVELVKRYDQERKYSRVWGHVTKWLFLGKLCSGSDFSSLPIEVIFHFVGISVHVDVPDLPVVTPKCLFHK